jgi:hypothetical protein
MWRAGASLGQRDHFCLGEARALAQARSPGRRFTGLAKKKPGDESETLGSRPRAWRCWGMKRGGGRWCTRLHVLTPHAT